ncbi:transposase, partial [Lacticaseibacillus jixianensis]|uniref:transposase n=1 Tax=Lacticaseibacillus jixianensis TaxID=2486012 RepID=UPI001783AA44
YATRKIEVEPVFGNMKHNLTFTRSSVRGLEPVRQELGLTLMAGNLQKLAILIDVHPDLLKGLLKWGSICRTLKIKIATKAEKELTKIEKPTELSRNILVERSVFFCSFDLCLSHFLRLAVSAAAQPLGAGAL